MQHEGFWLESDERFMQQVEEVLEQGLLSGRSTMILSRMSIMLPTVLCPHCIDLFFWH